MIGIWAKTTRFSDLEIQQKSRKINNEEYQKDPEDLETKH